MTARLGGSSLSKKSGNKTADNRGDLDYWVWKLDEKGAIIWQETYNFGKVDVLTSLVENDDHSFLLGGFAQLTTN